MTTNPMLRSLSGILVALLMFGTSAGASRAQCQAEELAKLTASDPFSMDEFGHAVAIDGGVAVIGVRQDDDRGDQAGCVYVYRYDGTRWNEEAKLHASDATPGDEFGVSVGISGDVLVAGAHLDDDGGRDSGSAYVFQYDGRTWAQRAKLTASDALGWDNFGWAVAIAGDAILVGANLADARGVNSGAAYMFMRPKQGWRDMTETSKLIASDGVENDEFGVSVDIDGDLAVIGAHYDVDEAGSMNGSAYVFGLVGSAWNQVAKLTASDGGAQDRFGLSVSVGGDVALVGAWADDDAGTQSGSAYVFEKPATGWADMTETAKLVPSDPVAGDHFGWSVALEGDVAIVAAPAHLFDGSGYGKVYLYQKPAGGWTSTTETALHAASDAAYQDEYGFSVSASGNIVLVGSRRDDTAGYDAAGSAYVHGGLSDCQPNGVIDVCDLAEGSSADDNRNGVPDECEGPGLAAGSTESTLTVGKTVGEEITLTWGPSCIAGDDDFEIYEGLLGDFASHTARFCTTRGEEQRTLLPGAGNRYYLVAPRNNTREGSLGKDSRGVDRPAAANACLPRLTADCR